MNSLRIGFGLVIVLGLVPTATTSLLAQKTSTNATSSSQALVPVPGLPPPTPTSPEPGSASNPYYVRDADALEQTPYAGSVSSPDYGKLPVLFESGDRLPWTKKMVIEHVSGYVYAPTGLVPWVGLETDLSGIHHLLVSGPISVSARYSVWVFSQPVRMYASPGSAVLVTKGFSPNFEETTFSGEASFNVSGYLEPVPQRLLPTVPYVR